MWAPFELEEGEPPRFVSLSTARVVEVFVNDHLALTTWVYPVRGEQRSPGCVRQGGTARLLRSISGR